MIRRIIDSVSLLVDSESQNNMEFFNDRDLNTNTFVESDSDDNNKNVPGVLSNTTCSFTDGLESFLSNDCLKEYAPSSITLSNSNSCYIANEDDLHQFSSSSDEEAAVTLPKPSTRDESQSPDMVDLSSIPLRSLPGGPSLQHPRSRLKLNTRKKEAHKCQNNIKSCLTAPASRKMEKDRSDFKTGGCFTQADPLVMELECHILPFYRNLTEIELRLPAKFGAKMYRSLLKQLAAEYELLILSIGKDRLHDECLVVRKRGALQQRQELELEEQKEKQRQKQLKEKEAAREAVEQIDKVKIELEKSQTDTGHQEISCQASFDEQKPEIGRKRAKRIRKMREQQRRAERNKKKTVTVDSFMQTVPEDYWLCPWCNDHIPPESQCGHEAICRAGVQQKKKENELKARLKQHQLYVEAKKRQRLGLPPLKNHQQQQHKSEITHSRSRSRNRDKSNANKHEAKSTGNITNPTIKAKTASAKLNEVHPNDMEAMIKLMQRLCTESKCQLLADSDCLLVSQQMFKVKT
ncbi:unnamed protein product [Trichobilharzia szidati]|nr:unnamed protein product [Trichobilharzia szidati]